MGRGTKIGSAVDVHPVGGSMTERSTKPIDVEGASDASVPWQRNEITSSFGPTNTTIVGWPDLSRTMGSLQDSGNPSGASTKGPQKISAPLTQPVVVERSGYGKRALHTMHEWEGVVERVGKNSFQCRLVPVTYGGGDPGKVEFTEFSFDDLATEADRSLAVPGAVFYWTVGRSRNAAGTVTNLSLVRFRRLPPLTPAQASLAEREAAALLHALGDRDGSDSARGW